MKKPLVVGAIAAAALVAVLVYRANDSHEESPSQAPAGTQKAAPATQPGAQQDPTLQPGAAIPKSGSSDPRLAALAVSPDNGLIEFVPGEGGRIIKEIDKDPNSPGFQKPLREYTYAGDNVIVLVAYHYFSDHTQITQTRVTYKPDGSVDQYLESTKYEYGGKKAN